MIRVFFRTLKNEFPVTAVFSAILTASLYLVIQEFSIAQFLDFSGIISRVPDPLKKMANSLLVINLFGGYLHLVASVDWVIVAGAFASLVSSGIIAGEREKKTLPLLLSYPVGRTSVILGKYFAVILNIAVLSIFSFLGFYLGTYHGLIKVPYDPFRYFFITVNGFLFFAGLSSVGLLFSAIFNEHKKAAVATLLFFILSYLSFFLGAFSPRWANIKNYTLFRFFDTEKLFMKASGFQWNDIFSLLIIAAIVTFAAVSVFKTSDAS